MKFKCHQLNGNHLIGEFTEEQKNAYENSPHTRGKYRFEQVKEARVPKGAKKVEKQKPSSDDDWTTFGGSRQPQTKR